MMDQMFSKQSDMGGRKTGSYIEYIDFQVRVPMVRISNPTIAVCHRYAMISHPSWPMRAAGALIKRSTVAALRGAGKGWLVMRLRAVGLTLAIAESPAQRP